MCMVGAKESLQGTGCPNGRGVVVALAVVSGMGELPPIHNSGTYLPTQRYHMYMYVKPPVPTVRIVFLAKYVNMSLTICRYAV